MPLPGETIGFVGTGTITRAIIDGLMKQPASVGRIIVSPRNAEIAAALATAYSSLAVAADNQAVVDASDVVFLAVRPQIAAEVIPSLRFRRGQLVVSVIAATGRGRLVEWIGPDVDLVQAIPLPFVENREGVTAIYPGHGRVAALFHLLGTCVECETREDYDLLAVASATMSLFFGQMGRIVDWLEGRGLPPESARAYMSAHFDSLARIARERQDVPLHTLAREYATKGGLNEQVWMDVDQKGGTRAVQEALDRVLSRITN